jgi:hypothetical protein
MPRVKLPLHIIKAMIKAMKFPLLSASDFQEQVFDSEHPGSFGGY